MKSLLLSLPLFLSLSAAAVAGPAIQLTADELRLHGIKFAPVEVKDDTAGPVLTGTVINSPQQNSALVSLYAGVLSRWLVAPGDSVEEGQYVAEIVSNDMVGIQENWIIAQSALEQAEYELEKDTRLFDAGIISERRLAQTERQKTQADFALRAALAQMDRAGFDGKAREALASGKMQSGTFYVVSPTGGQFVGRNTEVGERVDALTMVGQIRQQGMPWVTVEVPAAMAGGLKTGQTLSVTGSAERLTLRQKDSGINPMTQTVTVFAEFDDAPTQQVGEVISVTIPTHGNGVLVSGNAVVHNGNSTLVFVKSANGIVPTEVSVLPAGNFYLVTEGLSPDDEVVVAGSSILKGIMLGLGGGE